MGNTGCKKEIFATDDCEDVRLSEIKRILGVTRLSISVEEWREHGNHVVAEWLRKNQNVKGEYFYQKR